MTVVFGLMCDDGIVMAADTQITDRDHGLSYPAQKLHRLGDRAAWGGSGARSVLLDVERVLDSEAGAVLESDDVGRALQERVKPILEHHYSSFIAEIPGEKVAGTPSAYLLASGYDSEDRPWIVEINPHAMVGHYEDIGFHAIGSGAAMAQQAGTLLGHFRMTERSIRYGVVAAQRVLDALSYTSPSVGGPFNVVRITPDGVHQLDDDEIEEARRHAERWRQLEQKALDQLFD